MPYRIDITNASPIVISDATTTASGTMSAADKAKLDGLSGGITELIAGGGIELTPEPITSVGVVAVAASGVTPGSYTSANITVGADGRITAAASGVSAPILDPYTTGTRPSAAANPYLMIFNTDLGTIQVSDGTSWITVAAEAP